MVFFLSSSENHHGKSLKTMCRKGSRGKSACKENEIKKRAQTIKYLGENVKLSLLLQKILNGMEYETYANS